MLKNLVLLSSFLVFAISTHAASDNHNLTSNALGNAIGFPNIEYSYKLSEHLTFGVMGSNGKAKINNLEVKGSAVGLIARYYLKPAFTNSSWYLVTAANKNSFRATYTENAIEYIGESNQTVAGAGAGYHWFWDSFNISLGALLTNQSKTELYDNAGNKYKDSLSQNVTFDFTIGGKF